jgi:hypothetical protein
METIFLRGSRMEPMLALLKPVSVSVTIGTGGPFGADGPVIVTAEERSEPSTIVKQGHRTVPTATYCGGTSLWVCVRVDPSTSQASPTLLLGR